MAFPLSQGSDPETGTIPADVWTLICSKVSVAKISNEDDAEKQVWYTYTNIKSDAPVNFDDPSLKWRLKEDTAQFENGAGKSNIYAFAKDLPAKIGVQT